MLDLSLLYRRARLLFLNRRAAFGALRVVADASVNYGPGQFKFNVVPVRQGEPCALADDEEFSDEGSLSCRKIVDELEDIFYPHALDKELLVDTIVRLLKVSDAAPTGDAAAPPPDLDRNCIIIPHVAAQPDALTFDMHTAAMHVLQRPAHSRTVDIRDPMDIITIAKDGPGGRRYATVLRWYVTGERPIEEMGLDQEDSAPIDPEALPRVDSCVSYESS